MVSIGLMLLSGALLVDADGWLPNVLIEVGATFLLFAPLLFLTKRIEGRIDDVEHGQELVTENVATLTEKITEAQDEIRRTQEQLSEVVRSRLTSTRVDDRETFEKVGTEPTFATIERALSRAGKLGLISNDGCRVRIHRSNLHLRFWQTEDHGTTTYFTLESLNGRLLRFIDWGEDAASFLQELADGLVAEGDYPGDSIFEPTQVFADLQELLEMAHRHAVSGGEPLGRVVQYFKPQWVLTDEAIVSTNQTGYTILLSRIDELNWPSQVGSKPWVDSDSFNEAYEVGVLLYRARRLSVKPPSGAPDEPPF